jgi:hypothetical protein
VFGLLHPQRRRTMETILDLKTKEGVIFRLECRTFAAAREGSPVPERDQLARQRGLV